MSPGPYERLHYPNATCEVPCVPVRFQLLPQWFPTAACTLGHMSSYIGLREFVRLGGVMMHPHRLAPLTPRWHRPAPTPSFPGVAALLRYKNIWLASTTSKTSAPCLVSGKVSLRL